MSRDVMQALNEAAKGNGMDYSKWPDILQILLQKIEENVYNEFPPVKIPVLSASASRFAAPNGAHDSSQATPPPGSPHTTIPVTPQPATATGAATAAAAASSSTAAPAGEAAESGSASKETATTAAAASSPSFVPNSQPGNADDEPTTPTRGARPSSIVGQGASDNQTVSTVEMPDGALPPPLASLYEQIQGALHGPFGTVPPYTYQRLAELVLAPRAHYKTLPAYLRALDRVLSVSSTADVYPLKLDAGSSSAATSSGGAIDGFMTSSGDAGSSSGGGLSGGMMHEGFNGAELTRIPWLRDTAEHEQDESDDGGEVDAPGELIDGSAVSGVSGRDAGSHGYREGQQTILVNGLSRNVPADSLALHDEGSGEPGGATQGRADGGPGAGIASGSGVGGAVDEAMRARGPQEIGNEDIGPQRIEAGSMPGIVDLEAAVGRPGEGEVVPGSNVQVPSNRSRESAEAEQQGEASEASNKEEEGDEETSKKEDEDMTDDDSKGTDAEPAAVASE